MASPSRSLQSPSPLADKEGNRVNSTGGPPLRNPASTLFQRVAPSASFGFSLAELLIGLGIVGVVAALTVPSFLDGAQAAKRLAVLREDVALVKTLTADYAAGHAKPNETFKDYVFRTVNALRKCPYTTPGYTAYATVSATDTRTCRTTPAGASPPIQNRSTLLMHNGSTIDFFFYDTWGGAYKGGTGVGIDWNGDGPSDASDYLGVMVNHGLNKNYVGQCVFYPWYPGNSIPIGRIQPWCLFPVHVTRYNEVMGVS